MSRWVLRHVLLHTAFKAEPLMQQWLTADACYDNADLWYALLQTTDDDMLP